MIAFLDGGTTQTRLRVWDGQAVRLDTAVPIGARTGAIEGSGQALREAVQELIVTARRAYPLDAVVACGMLTSPTGLYEVPHLLAPVSTERLAGNLVSREIEGCGLILFIPGIRTQDMDMMRGEETEVTGLRQILGLRGPVNFLHFGSHDKLIHTGDDGIQGSLTNLNGELLSAMTGATILKSSTQNPAELSGMDQHWWRQGLEVARQHGLSRAAFLVRIGGLLRGATPGQGTSWLLGALAEGNWRWIEQAGPERLTVLYGRSTVTQPFAAYLADQDFPVQIASETDSAQAAVAGAALLYDLWRDLAGHTPSIPVQP